MEIVLGVLIAFCLLCAGYLTLGRLLTPPDGLYIFFLRPDGQAELEQQLRGCRWLRQTGLLRGAVCVVLRAPDLQTEQYGRRLLRQGLADYLLRADELAQWIGRNGES